MRFVGAVGYEILTNGATAARYAIPGDLITPASECSMSFGDPTDELLAAARELMFRTALAAGNSSNTQTIAASQVQTALVFRSQYLYLALAVLVTSLGILIVLPTFHGFWLLGRRVTMSPIETGKAFGALKLRSNNSNSTARELVREIGRRPLRYGTTTRADGVRVANFEDLSAYGQAPQLKLEMWDPEYVRMPAAGDVLKG